MILADMMELATDVCSVYGEVMSIFLQRYVQNNDSLFPVNSSWYMKSLPLFLIRSSQNT